jgi:tRNA(adenine34) deaminase
MCNVFWSNDSCSRIERIVFGASDSKKGLSDLIINPKSEILFNHQVSVIGGILEDDCKNLLDKFFKLRRKQKNSGLL